MERRRGTIPLDISPTNDDSRLSPSPLYRLNEDQQRRPLDPPRRVELKTFSASSKMQREMEAIRQDVRGSQRALQAQEEQR